MTLGARSGSLADREAIGRGPEPQAQPRTDPPGRRIWIERIRLSLDYRYQPVSEPVHASSLKPHMGVLDWDEIYRDWSDDALKYYWKQLDLTVTRETWLERHPETIRR